MRISRLVAAAAVSAVVLTPIVPAQANAPVKDTSKAMSKVKGGNDNRLLPFQEKAAANKQAVLQKKAQGKISPSADVVKIAKKRYVNLENEGTDRIFVVLADFGDTRHPAYPDANPDGTPASDAQTFDGPLNNQIPKPDRAVDNSTLWQANYDQAHYQNMYFNRMKAYFERQSSGRYSVDGAVTDWVRVPFNEARYGRDSCGDIVCNNTWFLIRDALAQWTQDQLDQGQTMDQIRAYLSTFDKQDRYDIDGDGNFNEPDGFIDHFQIVHAGGDQAADDPTYGSDAIWSHRWYAAIDPNGPGGLPGVNVGEGGLSGGTVQIPDNPTGIWVGDYTIQPENGGLGVFSHEFTHDLGMPDLYDTSGNTGGAENSTGFWSLMSSGANIGSSSNKGIGDAPTDLGAWERYNLGWLDRQGSKGPFFKTIDVGKGGKATIGPNDAATDKYQALIVNLPDKHVPLELGTAPEGDKFFYSGSGNDLNNTMTLTSGVSAGELTAKVKYETEETYDYAFLEASTDGGTTFTPVVTNISDTGEDGSGNNSSGAGISGSSGGDWVDLTATLPSGTDAIRFRYQTDPAVAELGFMVDAIAIDGTVVGTAESDEGWVFDGFRTTTGTEDQSFFNAYVVENRQYDRYDTSLKTAYNFGFTDSRPDWVEKYPYQNGLLISYWDDSFSDNNVGDHPGGGLILPVDAHPTFFHTYDGQLARPRTLTFDSTFSLDRTDRIVIHKDSQKTVIPSQKAVSSFDDRKTWWYDDDGDGVDNGRYQPGWVGVDVPKTGTTIKITGGWNHDQFMIVKVGRH